MDTAKWSHSVEALAFTESCFSVISVGQQLRRGTLRGGGILLGISALTVPMSAMDTGQIICAVPVNQGRDINMYGDVGCSDPHKDYEIKTKQEGRALTNAGDLPLWEGVSRATFRT